MKLKEMVGVPGFEPGASCTPCRRASELRHTPTHERSNVGSRLEGKREAERLDRTRNDSTGARPAQRAIPGRGAARDAIICVSMPLRLMLKTVIVSPSSLPSPQGEGAEHSAERERQLTTNSESTMEELRQRLADLADHVAGIMVRL